MDVNDYLYFDTQYTIYTNDGIIFIAGIRSHDNICA